jgi:dihydrofolate reductase
VDLDVDRCHANSVAGSIRKVAKFLYSAAMSVDGFIAGRNGDMSWLAEYVGPNPTTDELIPHVGALLVGRRTFFGDDPLKGQPGEGEAFGGGWDGPQFVLTHHPPAEEVPGITFVAGLNSAVEKAAAAAGDNYVNILGADVAAQCLRAGVLDEVLVWVVPVLLGEGTKLFDHPGGVPVRLVPMHTTNTPQATSLWYRVQRAARASA